MPPLSAMACGPRGPGRRAWGRASAAAASLSRWPPASTPLLPRLFATGRRDGIRGSGVCWGGKQNLLIGFVVSPPFPPFRSARHRIGWGPSARSRASPETRSPRRAPLHPPPPGVQADEWLPGRHRLVSRLTLGTLGPQPLRYPRASAVVSVRGAPSGGSLASVLTGPESGNGLSCQSA